MRASIMQNYYSNYANIRLNWLRAGWWQTTTWGGRRWGEREPDIGQSDQRGMVLTGMGPCTLFAGAPLSCLKYAKVRVIPLKNQRK